MSMGDGESITTNVQILAFLSRREILKIRQPCRAGGLAPVCLAGLCTAVAFALLFEWSI